MGGGEEKEERCGEPPSNRLLSRAGNEASPASCRPPPAHLDDAPVRDGGAATHVRQKRGKLPKLAPGARSRADTPAVEVADEARGGRAGRPLAVPDASGARDGLGRGAEASAGRSLLCPHTRPCLTSVPRLKPKWSHPRVKASRPPSSASMRPSASSKSE